MRKSDPDRCMLSGSRQHISVADEIAKRTRCPKPNGCGRVLRVRPTRRADRLNPNGNPVATLPQHKTT